MTIIQALRSFTTRRTIHRFNTCELCGAAIAADHPHVADVEKRALTCACRPCALLFTGPGAAEGRWRTIPDRHLRDPDFALTDAEWSALGIPVSMAFFFKSSSAEGWTAVYPSPAGPVESLLRLEAWDSILSSTNLAKDIERDVEALLVTAAGDGFECMLVPIHTCYALVGQVRRHWRGLDGGEEARLAIAGQVEALRARCETRETKGAVS